MADMDKEKEEILNEEEKAEECCEEKAEEASAKTGEEKDELKEMSDKYMRLAAEYQNFRRRTENEKQDIATFANERIAKELLNVVDSFERALTADFREEESIKNGVELIYKQLMGVLSNFGVEPVKAEGEAFDPNFHHAVLSEEADGIEAGIVLMEMQKGYTLKGRVLRPAMVKVSA